MNRIFTFLFLLATFTLSAQEPIDTDGDGFRNISTLEQLRWVSENDSSWSWNFELDNDIDASDTKNWNEDLGFTPIGIYKTKFSGKFNGHGYKIDSLFISRSNNNYIGFIGFTDGAEISNVGLTNCNVTGGDYVGGLVGVNDKSTISNSYSTGIVTGDFPVGGLVGISYHNSEIINSYSTSIVNGEEAIGGLVGYNDSSEIINSYSIGMVTGEEAVGGLVGRNDSSPIINCFWDTETSGQSFSAGGIGKKTAEMKTKSTFIDVGWNFKYFWNIDGITNEGYPFITYKPIEVAKGIEPIDTDGNGFRNISLYAHLLWITENSSSWTWSFELDNDINAVPTYFSLSGFSPIGKSTKKFSGKFNGNGYKIDSLFIYKIRYMYAGLFGFTDGAEISNIGITNCNITSRDNCVGSLVGNNISTSISNCYSTGNVTGNIRVGGLVGRSCIDSKISNCFSTCKVSGDGSIGGLAGQNCYNSEIINSFSTGRINGGNGAGGLVGVNERGKINNSYSTGNIIGNNSVGGLVGINNYYSEINNSYSIGNVIGNNSVGGLVGYNFTFAQINNSYSTVIVSGSNVIGGLVGSVANSTIRNCFWDTETSGLSISASGTGKTTAEMKTKSTFTDVGWNFKLIWNIDGITNNGYPFIDYRTIPIPEGIEPIDTDTNGFRNISLFVHLLWVSKNDSSWSWNFELDNDINANPTYLSLAGFSPIGNPTKKFSGKFNGNGHKIDSLFIYKISHKNIGFFGYTNGAEISNLGVTNCNVTGSNYVGGLVGFNLSTSISNCYSTGRVNGSGEIGGLVGYVDNYSVISNSSNTCNVTGNYSFGGLVGYINNHSAISNSFNTGSVIGGQYAGGLVGYINNHSAISNSFNTGSVTGDYITGGLVGESSNSSVISNSSNTGSVTGDYTTGGLVGQSSNYSAINNSFNIGSVTGDYAIGGLAGFNIYSSEINNSYSTGNISGNVLVGGLVGYNVSSSISNSYSMSSVSGSDIVGGLVGRNMNVIISNSYSTGSVSGNSLVGGLVGEDDNDYSSEIISCFWDTETSGKTNSAGGTGKSTAEMKTKSNFTDAGWDFDEIWFISEDVNDGYPALFGLDNPPTSVSDEMITDDTGITISPNPASDFIEISINKPSEGFEPSEGLEVAIYDVLGEKVISESIHPMTQRHRMNVANLPRGVYFIRIGAVVEKFVKM